MFDSFEAFEFRGATDFVSSHRIGKYLFGFLVCVFLVNHDPCYFILPFFDKVNVLCWVTLFVEILSLDG
jgi:hypothetical protein